MSRFSQISAIAAPTMSAPASTWVIADHRRSRSAQKSFAAGLPLVRYVTGDLVRVSAQPCGCGEADPVIEVLGRADDVIEIGGARATQYDVLDGA